MTTSKLPARPSLESLRKQAKQLARGIAAADPQAIARARAQLPKAAFPLSQREAQLVLAREYGFPGWQDLVKEVNQRLGRGLEWAAAEARSRIHDNDVEGLRQLLAEFPALLSWQGDENSGGLLAMATGSYGDSFDASRERNYTRAECAELLINAGAIVTARVLEGLLVSRTRRLLELFHDKGLLPQSLRFLAARGETEGIAARLAAKSDDLAAVNEALLCACRFQQGDAAALLLERSIALDGEMGKRIDGGPGRAGFIEYMMKESETLAFLDAGAAGVWEGFVLRQIARAVQDGNRERFTGGLRRETWILSEPYAKFQARLIEQAVLGGRGDFIAALLELTPAILHSQPAPASQAFEFAFTYGKTELLPLLLRIWPLPDDLPHAAGSGDPARVRKWFDEAGRPVLGDLSRHFPTNNRRICRDLQWFEPSVQQVLDTALAWAVINNHFEIADFLLEHGADINTRWGSHEPASILHELVFRRNYEAMQFLIDRGIDLTITDYRWQSTARGWAIHAAKDEKMAQWLQDAEERRAAR